MGRKFSQKPPLVLSRQAANGLRPRGTPTPMHAHSCGSPALLSLHRRPSMGASGPNRPQEPLPGQTLRLLDVMGHRRVQGSSGRAMATGAYRTQLLAGFLCTLINSNGQSSVRLLFKNHCVYVLTTRLTRKVTVLQAAHGVSLQAAGPKSGWGHEYPGPPHPVQTPSWAAEMWFPSPAPPGRAMGAAQALSTLLPRSSCPGAAPRVKILHRSPK